MKKLNISDLATILQLDASIKEDLTKNFDNFDDNAKDKILKILWDGIHELKDKLAKIKYEEFLLEVDEGKRELTTDLYYQAVKAVWQDFDDIVSGKVKDTSQIEEIKKQLQNFSQDLQQNLPPSPTPSASNAGASDAGGPPQNQ